MSVTERTPHIRVSKTGLVSINIGLSQLLNLKKGDALELIQDEDHPKDWFIAKSVKGFKVWTKDDKAFALNNVFMSKTFLKSLNIPGSGASFPVSSDPIKEGNYDLYAIITANPKNVK